MSEKWNSQSSVEVIENHNGAIQIEKNASDDFENCRATSTSTSPVMSNDEDAKMARKSDLAKALDTDLSKLDSMIEQAENAQYSMSHQSRQMKKFLN